MEPQSSPGNNMRMSRMFCIKNNLQMLVSEGNFNRRRHEKQNLHYKLKRFFNCFHASLSLMSAFLELMFFAAHLIVISHSMLAFMFRTCFTISSFCITKAHVDGVGKIGYRRNGNNTMGLGLLVEIGVFDVRKQRFWQTIFVIKPQDFRASIISFA